MRTLVILAILAGCASKKPEAKAPANAAPAAEPRKETKDNADKDAAPKETKRRSDPCEGGQ
jgi:hypothetical protein